ncbi:MAG TPA: hypothetical protein VF359_01715 [Anaerolineales bacterium]
MTSYALCLAWNWEFDADFVHLLEVACTRVGLSFFSVTIENLDATLAGLATGEISFACFFDRASESDSRFQPLVDRARQPRVFRINPQEMTTWSADKATMHLEFVSRRLDTPYTILLSSCQERPDLTQLDLSPLGGRFAIKPASLGGGEGVVLEATSQDQVLSVRQQYPREKYLLQAHVTPRVLDGRTAWFRVLVCDGAVYPCWWDQHTHVYTRVSADERFRFGLVGLFQLARRISLVCRLHLFSTEIALTTNGCFMAVDYVNDPVDLRLQSKAADGVPDAWVENIAGRLARLAERNIPHE